MHNQYLVSSAPPATLDISALDRERRFRRMRYEYSGVIDEDYRHALLQNIAEWNVGTERRRNINKQYAETLLRILFDELFKADINDEVNLSAQEWEKVVFHIEEAPTNYHGGHSGIIKAKSTDSRHTIGLQFITIQQKERVIMTYWGPQMFKPFKGKLGSELRRTNDDGTRISG